jgi:Adenylate and Guanylate cyclase catalytic domain
MTEILYPVINRVDRVWVAGAADYKQADNDLVAMLASSIYWRSFIRNILPEGSNGIHVVFSNPCTATFTYQINGPSVQYLGIGDHHQRRYTEHGISKSIYKLGRNTNSESVYTGAPIDEDYCPIAIALYPSDEMKSLFTTYHPIIFPIVVLFIFAFVSVVFFMYDKKVERRQQSIMSTAVRSSAIVSSLFPSEVRDRLYPTEGAVKSTSRKSLSPETAKGKLHSFLRESNKLDVTVPTPDAWNLLGSSPIAELYPETTVLFADISGFTAWSSERHPTQVFHLLETVYAAFDAIAKSRGVFKVETIGDCYVAVVGLPTPRKHHAVVMARFARDCRDKMAKITEELASILGPVSSISVACEALWTSALFSHYVNYAVQ